jgi:hypothetical protein
MPCGTAAGFSGGKQSEACRKKRIPVFMDYWLAESTNQEES